jgi:CRISPR/Cas system-associated protein Csm6
MTGTAVATATATGRLTSVSLEKEAEREQLSVDDRIKLDDQNLRQGVADRVMRTFVRANAVTLVVLCTLVALDEINIWLHLIAPTDRIITNQVIMALLGATTIQVGAIAAIIARYLFPGRSRDS